MNTGKNTTKIVMTALMIAIITVSVMLIKVPIPFTQGYVHLGDAMIIMAVMVLGWKYGAVAGAIGAALGDILGGFPVWAPWTFAIKGVMAIILGLMIAKGLEKQKAMVGKMPLTGILGIILSGAAMVAGYYVAEGIMYGNWAVAAIGIPWNVGQFVVGIVVAAVLTGALMKTPARKYFAIRFDNVEK